MSTFTFIWIIGVLFTIGMMDFNSKRPRWQSAVMLVVILALWPLPLGIAVRERL